MSSNSDVDVRVSGSSDGSDDYEESLFEQEVEGSDDDDDEMFFNDVEKVMATLEAPSAEGECPAPADAFTPRNEQEQNILPIEHNPANNPTPANDLNPANEVNEDGYTTEEFHPLIETDDEDAMRRPAEFHRAAYGERTSSKAARPEDEEGSSTQASQSSQQRPTTANYFSTGEPRQTQWSYGFGRPPTPIHNAATSAHVVRMPPRRPPAPSLLYGPASAATSAHVVPPIRPSAPSLLYGPSAPISGSSVPMPNHAATSSAPTFSDPAAQTTITPATASVVATSTQQSSSASKSKTTKKNTRK